MNEISAVTDIAPIGEKPRADTIIAFEKEARQLDRQRGTHGVNYCFPLRGGQRLSVFVGETPGGSVNLVAYDKISRKPDKYGYYASQGYMVSRDISGRVTMFRTSNSYVKHGPNRFVSTGDGTRQMQPVSERDLQISVSELKAALASQRRRDRKWSRMRLATAAAGLVLAVGGSYVTHKLDHPSAEQVVYPPGSLEAAVQELSKSPRVLKQETITDVRVLASQYQPNDFYLLKNPLGIHTDGKEKFDSYSGIPTAPVVEITYDRDTNTLRANGIDISQEDKDLAYHLYAPLVKNIPLRAAFASGKIDRLVIRINKKAEEKEYVVDYTNVIWGKYENKDNTDPTRPNQKTMFIFLPAMSLSRTDLIILTTHESLHALSADSPLSGFNNERPSPSDAEAWRNICSAIRYKSIEQASAQYDSMISIMKEHLNSFQDEAYKAFKKVYEALERREFITMQPTTGDPEFDLRLKVPECTALGPWDTFIVLLQKQGITYEPESEVVLYDVYLPLRQAWLDVIQKTQITSALSEGYYKKAAGSNDDIGGHIERSLDEKWASSTNLILLLPKEFAETIKALPDDQRAIALRFIEAEIREWDKQVPDQKAFHDFLDRQYDVFKRTLA